MRYKCTQMEKFEVPFLYGVTFLIDRDRDSLILSIRTDYFVEIHEKITIEELINH
jgi:hypothetical protein